MPSPGARWQVTEVELRRAVADDAPALRRIAEAAYLVYVPRIGRKPAPMVADFVGHIDRDEAWLAEADGAPAGYLIGYPREADWFVENLAVDPRYQGLGIGHRLMALAESEARRGAYACVVLYTNQRMWENAGFYGRLGFQVTHTVEEAGFHRVYMVKDLQDTERGAR